MHVDHYNPKNTTYINLIFTHMNSLITRPLSSKAILCIPPAYTATIFLSSKYFTLAGRSFSKTSSPRPNWPQSPLPTTNTWPMAVCLQVNGNISIVLMY